MGRTVPSFRIALGQEIDSWREFKHSLHGLEKKFFEDMVNRSRCYASAASAAVRLFRFEAFFMTITLDHYKSLLAIAEGLEEERLVKNAS